MGTSLAKPAGSFKNAHTLVNFIFKSWREGWEIVWLEGQKEVERQVREASSQGVEIVLIK